MKLNNSLWKDQPVICITFDVDWASEDSLKYTLNLVEKYGFNTTFFLTHHSNILLSEIKNRTINGGIHPNFLSGSSQGKNAKEIIEYCTKLLPDANSYRCHKYFDNNDINDLLIQNGFKYDSNLCTYLEIIEPFVHRSGLVRIPIYFEDGAYLLHGNNLNFKEVQGQILNGNGLMVFNFHPMHLIINTPDFSYMRRIKNNLSKKVWNNLTYKEIEHLANNGKGIRTFAMDLFSFIKKENFLILNLEEVYNNLIKDRLSP